jgi:PAS domain S-box-containing protein
MIKTKEQLTIENEALHFRLNEMEEAIDAIRNGEVDAIMVTGKMGEQVYSVSTAETPYRTFIEQMSEGAVTLTKDGTILYCNPRFAEIIQSPYEKVIGASIKNFITPNDNSKLDTLLAQLPLEKHDVLVVSLSNTIYLRLSIHLLPPYLQGDNYIIIATDISDLKKKEHEQAVIISKLENHVKILRTLRIDNIRDTLDAEGRKIKLEIANTKLSKEISKLNNLIVNLKLQQNKPNN